MLSACARKRKPVRNESMKSKRSPTPSSRQRWRSAESFKKKRSGRRKPKLCGGRQKLKITSACARKIDKEACKK